MYVVEYYSAIKKNLAICNDVDGAKKYYKQSKSVREKQIPYDFIQNYFNIFFLIWERERERAWVRERSRERETDCEASSTLSIEPNAGLNRTTPGIMTWAKTKSQMLNQLSHPGTLVDITNDII